MLKIELLSSNLTFDVPQQCLLNCSFPGSSVAGPVGAGGGDDPRCQPHVIATHTQLGWDVQSSNGDCGNPQNTAGSDLHPTLGSLCHCS